MLAVTHSALYSSVGAFVELAITLLLFRKFSGLRDPVLIVAAVVIYISRRLGAAQPLQYHQRFKTRSIIV